MRNDNRSNDQIRDIQIIKNYTKHAEGSVLISYGDTKVICTASIIFGVPRFLKGSNQGWLTAEYGMLPRSTNERINREAIKGQSGRTQEIQRLIGRSLRAAIDLSLLGENTITIDCDVIQADGGTRTASITGGCVALFMAIDRMLADKTISRDPRKYLISAVSVGICNEQVLVDLNYQEDSNAETDLNVVATENNEFIEIQGTAEQRPFTHSQLQDMLKLANKAVVEINQQQMAVLNNQ